LSTALAPAASSILQMSGPAPSHKKSYGTLSYSQNNKCWEIECEPHVSVRLKRVFGKLDKGSTGKHVISDTPENAQDICWFLNRYPMASAYGEHLYAQARRRRESLTLVDTILAGNYVPPTFDLAVPAREYQKVAAALWLARGGLLIADDVGLGKTATAICGFTDPRTLPAVVVTMTHLPKQWQAEIKKFMPRLTTHIVKSGKPYLIWPFPDVIIINYHKLVGWAEHLLAVGRVRSIVFDECQELRKGAEAKEDKKSAKYRAAEYLVSHIPFRCGTSATPIYNYGVEFFSVVNCLCPGELGTKEEFATEWCGGAFHDKATIKETKAFGAYMRDSGIMLRRTRSEVGRELPEAQVVMQIVESDEKALDSVSNSCAELARLILDSAKETERGRKMQASEELSNMLRQATGIAKAPHVADFVRILLESGEKVVLYGWHRTVYQVWREKLGEFKPAMYTGSESIPQKEESKRRFISGETNLLIISLRSGAGLDGLQHVCRIVVFGELDWSSGVHEQNIGRVLRDGQKDSVLVYYLVSEEGSDPTMCEVNGIKKQQLEGVRRNPGEEFLVQELQTDGGHMRRLAEAYLARKRS
jgi:SNF2 family DNA or RNA helicase